jgi:RNA polymerase sigma factor (sigma-70 family)
MTTSVRLGLLVRHLRRVALAEPAGPLPDGELLRRFRETRDEGAFATLVERHGPMVLGVCRGVLRSWHDAEDAFQATFLILARKADSIQRPGSLAGWLHGVAYHLALRARTRAARRPPQEPGRRDMPSDDPLLDLTGRELQEILHEELHQLPEKYRAPLVLCYLEGKTQEQAARQLRWSRGTVRGRLDRGREQLRKRLAGRGLALSVCTALLAHRATAAVPAALAEAAVRSATGPAAGVISASVADLVNGASNALFPGKVPVVSALCLAVGLLGAGLGVSAAGALSAPQVREKASRPAAPAAGRQVRVDPHGDPLPEGVLQRLGTGRLRHGNGVHGLTFAGGGKGVLSVGTAAALSMSLLAWDTTTGKGRKRGQFPHSSFHSNPASAFSADGKLLALVGSYPGGLETIFLRDAATGKEVRHFASHQDMVLCATFSPDGKTLATGQPGRSAEAGRRQRGGGGDRPPLGRGHGEAAAELAQTTQVDYGPCFFTRRYAAGNGNRRQHGPPLGNGHGEGSGRSRQTIRAVGISNLFTGRQAPGVRGQGQGLGPGRGHAQARLDPAAPPGGGHGPGVCRRRDFPGGGSRGRHGGGVGHADRQGAVRVAGELPACQFPAAGPGRQDGGDRLALRGGPAPVGAAGR